MENLYSLTSILNIIFLIAAMVGGYIAIRSGKHRTSGEIQAQVIDALKAELEALQRRMDSLEKRIRVSHRHSISYGQHYGSAA